MSSHEFGRRGAGSQPALRAANRRRLLAVLALSGPRSQSELSRETGLSSAAVSGLVRELADERLVDLRPGLRRGRRVVEVWLGMSDHLVFAVDAGHRHLRAAIANSVGGVLIEQVEQRHLSYRIADDVQYLAHLRDELLDRAGRDLKDLAVIVIGLPVPFSPSGPGRLAREWSDPLLTARLDEALGAPVLLENDANLGALGEARLGAGVGCDDFVYIKVAHGLGAGMVLGGHLYRGGLHAAGEIGHVSVDESGALCTCGGRGCLESYVGASALAASLADIHGSRPTIAEIVERCQDGEPPYVRAVADAGRMLGFALANVVNLLAPSRIVLGGELSTAGPILSDATRLGVQYGSARTLAEQVEVLTAGLLDRAEIVGAIAMGTSFVRSRLDLPDVELTAVGEE